MGVGVASGAVALVLGLRTRRVGARAMGTAAVLLAAVTVVLPLAWTVGAAVS